jgi:putative flippase GtrA
MRARLIRAGDLQAVIPFARFLLIGGVNTLFGYAIFLAGLLAGLPPEAALAIATLLGALFNYVLTARFVFGHRAADRLPVFAMAYGGLYAINAAAIRILVQAGASAALAQAALTPAMAAVAFLLFRNVVFRRDRTP